MAIPSVKLIVCELAFLAWFAIPLVSFANAQPSQATENASWMWHPQDDQQVQFTRSFDIASPVAIATLQVATQYTHCEVFLDDQLVASVEAYDPLLTTNIASVIGSGSHSLVVRCNAVDGPSSFFLTLDLQLIDGSHKSIVSNGAWLVSAGDGATNRTAVALQNVGRKMLIPASQRVGISATENYEQWKQALGESGASDPATFQVADGFEIRLVRAAKNDEDSWVSFAFDPQGRIIVAKEQVGLLRMTLSDDGNSVLHTESMDATLKECRGLVWRGSELFANANDSKAMFRLGSLENGSLTNPKELFLTPGGAGHGRNDLCVGPDGMIYSIHGDSVDLPTAALDHTSPYREAQRGEKTSEGHLIRFDPDSGKAELLTAGLRNPFGIDFNTHGEAFTYDADAEYDMGSPWYRPTRVNHLVVGGDYGWRGVTKAWPPYYCDRADNAHRNLDIGKGSPTAVKFGTHSNFPLRYREALFVLDWAYGRVLAVNMIPRGASYLMAAETFLQGRPLNVTDIDFAPDGSMYLITGGRKTQSAIYRVQFSGTPAKDNPVDNAYQSACETFAADARDRRRQLESMLRDQPKQENIETVWESLSDHDPWIRYAATNVLERHPTAWWSDRALSEPSVIAMLSLARSGETKYRPALLQKLNTLAIDQQPLSRQLEILQTYQLALSSTEKLETTLVSATIDRLRSLYPSDRYPVNRLLSQLLTDLNVNEITATTIELIRLANSPIEKLQYLYALRHTKNGWTIDDRETYFRELAQASQSLGGAGMPDFLAKIRAEATATLRPMERDALDNILKPNAMEPIKELEPRAFVRQWTVDELDDAINENRRPDLIRGKQLFAAASCSRCHRVNGEGTLIGPDLTAASGRYRRRDLLAAIIEPSLVIAENYQSIQVVTDDGETYAGQIAPGGDYRSPVLRLATDATKPFEVVEIDKTQIESQRYSPVSWMPAGLLNTLSADEAHDLVAYIESGGR